MKIIMAFIYATITIMVITITSAMVTLAPNWSEYEKVYDKLPKKDFYIINKQVYTHRRDEKDDGFIWFVESNSFALKDGVSLNGMFIMKFDPYSHYWNLKYKEWFKNNININKIKKY